MAKAAVVLGMHRGGTSLLAQVLARLGVDMGDNLKEADRHNQSGYWEDMNIVSIQKRIMAGLGRHLPCCGFDLPRRWPEAEAIQPLVAQLRATFLAKIATGRPLWGFKDPRTARLLPLWSPLFQEAGVAPVYLLSVRSPGACAASLERRNRMPRRSAELLWLAHMTDALAHTGGQVCVLHYERWFSEPAAQLEALCRCLGLEDREISLAGVVDPALNHGRQGVEEEALPLAARLYADLSASGPDGAVPPRAMDTVRAFRQAQDEAGFLRDHLDDFLAFASHQMGAWLFDLPPELAGRSFEQTYRSLRNSEEARLRLRGMLERSRAREKRLQAELEKSGKGGQQAE